MSKGGGSGDDSRTFINKSEFDDIRKKAKYKDSIR